MTVKEYMRGWVLRVVVFTAIAAPAQTTATPAAADPCKPAAPPAAVEKEKAKLKQKTVNAIGGIFSKHTGGAVDGSDVKSAVDGAKTDAPKPCPVKLPEKPAAPAVKEMCPPSTSRVEGQPYCTDGNKLLDVIRVPVAGSSTAAQVSQAPGQPAR